MLACSAPWVQASVLDALRSPHAGYTEKIQALAQAGRYDYAGMVRLLNEGACCTALTVVQERSFLNQVMNHLRREYDPVLGLENALIALAHDKSRDLKVREYALQHMALGLNRFTYKAPIIEFLHQVADTRELGVSALVQLHYLTRRDVPINRDRFVRQIIDRASEDRIPDGQKAVLLAIVGNLPAPEALPVVRWWAVESDTPMIVNGTIDVIRVLGNVDDLAFLEVHVVSRQLSYTREKIESAKRALSAHN
jgi:hypothetical protein